MSGINSIGSSSSYSYTGNVQRQGRDPSKIADSVFSKLDTKNQGYLEVSDLEAAFSNISSSASSSTTGTSNATSTASATGTTATSSATGNSASIDDLFKKLDSDGDGKVTKDEFSAGIKNLSSALDNQFHARRAGGGHRPPPPQDGGGGGGDNGGLDKTQLGDLATTVGKSNSAAGAALTQVAQNFDAADTNQDGKVSFAETLAYLEKTVTSTQATTSTASGSTSTASSASTTGTNSIASLTSSTSATSATANSSSSSNSDSNSNSSTDAALFKKALQLLRAYSAPPEASNGQGISVSA